MGSDPGGALPLCTNLYRVQYGDTCASLIRSKFNNVAVEFFKLNPGLYCTNFNAMVASNNTLGQKVQFFCCLWEGTSLNLEFLVVSPIFQICVSATNPGTILQGCQGKVVVPTPGDSCSILYRKHFCSKRLLFRKFNRRWDCQDKRLFLGPRATTKRVSLCAPRLCWKF